MVICHGDGGLRSYHNYYIPKAIGIVSSSPLFRIHDNLIGIFHAMRNSSANRICYSVGQDKMYDSIILKKDESRFSISKVRNNDHKLYFTPEFVWSFYISAVYFHSRSHYSSREIVFSSMNNTESLHLSPIHNTLYSSHSQLHAFSFYLSATNISRLLSCILL